MDPCTESEKLGAYHDSELPDALRQRLEAHLAVCATCRAELKALERLSARLTAAPRPALSPAALARMHNPTRQWYLPRLMIRTSGSLAAAAALVLVSVLFWSRWAPPGTAPTPGVAVTSLAPSRGWESLAIAGQPQNVSADSAQIQLAQWTAEDLERN
jgi:anti-sigma factor RsiW